MKADWITTSEVELNELRGILDSAISEIPEHLRVAFVRAELNGDRITDIARDLGITGEAVRGRVRKAMRKLFWILQRDYYEIKWVGVIDGVMPVRPEHKPSPSPSPTLAPKPKKTRPRERNLVLLQQWMQYPAGHILIAEEKDGKYFVDREEVQYWVAAPLIRLQLTATKYTFDKRGGWGCVIFDEGEIVVGYRCKYGWMVTKMNGVVIFRFVRLKNAIPLN